MLHACLVFKMYLRLNQCSINYKRCHGNRVYDQDVYFIFFVYHYIYKCVIMILLFHCVLKLTAIYSACITCISLHLLVQTGLLSTYYSFQWITFVRVCMCVDLFAIKNL